MQHNDGAADDGKQSSGDRKPPGFAPFVLQAVWDLHSRQFKIDCNTEDPMVIGAMVMRMIQFYLTMAAGPVKEDRKIIEATGLFAAAGRFGKT